jgi:hypothetical protein
LIDFQSSTSIHEISPGPRWWYVLSPVDFGRLLQTCQHVNEAFADDENVHETMARRIYKHDDILDVSLYDESWKALLQDKNTENLTFEVDIALTHTPGRLQKSQVFQMFSMHWSVSLQHGTVVLHCLSSRDASEHGFLWPYKENIQFNDIQGTDGQHRFVDRKNNTWSCNLIGKNHPADAIILHPVGGTISVPGRNVIIPAGEEYGHVAAHCPIYMNGLSRLGETEI